jgi:hypothetical protein
MRSYLYADQVNFDLRNIDNEIKRSAYNMLRITNELDYDQNFIDLWSKYPNQSKTTIMKKMIKTHCFEPTLGLDDKEKEFRLHLGWNATYYLRLMLKENTIKTTLQNEMRKQWTEREELTSDEGSLVFHYVFYHRRYKFKNFSKPKFVIAFGPPENQKYPEFMKLQFKAIIDQNDSGHNQIKLRLTHNHLSLFDRDIVDLDENNNVLFYTFDSNFSSGSRKKVTTNTNVYLNSAVYDNIFTNVPNYFETLKDINKDYIRHMCSNKNTNTLKRSRENTNKK